MPPAAMIAVAALAAGAQAYGARQQSKAQNQIYQTASQRFNPQNINNIAGGLNPALMRAMGIPVSELTPLNSWDPNRGMTRTEGYESTGYEDALRRLVENPGGVDQALMNLPMHRSAMRQNQDLLAAQGSLGRSNMSGGLSQAYALANQGARTMRDVETMQNFSLWSEQQKRQDLDWLTRMLQSSQGQAAELAGGQAQYGAMQQAPMNAWQMGGNVLGATNAAAGYFYGPNSQQQQQGQQAGGGSPVMMHTPYRFPGMMGQAPSGHGANFGGSANPIRNFDAGWQNQYGL